MIGLIFELCLFQKPSNFSTVIRSEFMEFRSLSSVPRSERIQGNLIRGLESCDKLINKIQGVVRTITAYLSAYTLYYVPDWAGVISTVYQYYELHHKNNVHIVDVLQSIHYTNLQ